MLEFIKTIIFGIVEGITEWLPVSSTGHLILLNKIMPLNVSESFYSMFEVIIQFGAILAVVLAFWSKIWPFGKKKNKCPLSENGIGQYIKKDIFDLWFHILAACVPAAIVGILWDELFESLFYNYVTVAIMLILVGIAFIVIEDRKKDSTFRVEKISQITYKDALLIGAFQLIAAIFPGTSRSGATIIGALLIGINRTAAAEFTFYLAVPVMLGASLLKLLKFGLAFSSMEMGILLVGMIVSFVVSVFVIRFLMSYIKKHDFKVFGWYRIALGVIVLVFGLFILK